MHVSAVSGMIERMFELKLPSLDALGALGNAGLVDVMQQAARLQAAALARVFAAGAELYHRRQAEQEVARREIWAIDGW